MNIFSLAFGMVFLAGAILCMAALVVLLLTKRWKTAGTLLGLCSGSLGLILFLVWLNDPYARSPVSPSEVVGTYQLSASGAKRLSITGYKMLTGTFALKSDGTCSADKLPACCIHGDDERVYPFTGGYCSFSGTWSIDRSSEVYIVKIDMKKLEMSDGAESGDLPSEISLHIFKNNPRALAFSIFNGDFDDIVYVPISSP